MTATNCFVIKSLFQITWLLTKKNRAHSNSFKPIAELVAACSGEEIKKHLLHAPQNANCMSPEYIPNIFKSWIITSSYLFLHHFVLLAHNDETSDVTTTKQMTVYATFNYQGTIKENYVGIIPISKLVGTKLNAPNIMKALIKFFNKIYIPIMQARFSCMDNTNVNSGSCGSLKRYILHEIPMALWVGCRNSKLTLCFKHLLKEFYVLLSLM